MDDLAQTCTCHKGPADQCEVEHHREPLPMSKPLTSEDIEAMAEYVRSLGSLDIINTPAALIESFVSTCAGIYDTDEHCHTNEEWAALSDQARQEIEMKGLVDVLFEYHGDDQEHQCIKEVARSVARIYLEDEDLIDMLGGDPLPRKMKRIRARREGNA